MTSTHFIHIVTSRRPCWWSRSFSPLGTKLYFHVNSWRKNYIVLTFNIITFSRGCKPRITSYLIVGSIWPVTMPQRAYPLGFAVFFVLGGLLTTPQACRKRQFPIPELLINLIYVFWGYIFSRAKLISINFSNLTCWVWFCMHNSYQASSFLFVTGLCIITSLPSPFKKY